MSIKKLALDYYLWHTATQHFRQAVTIAEHVLPIIFKYMKMMLYIEEKIRIVMILSVCGPLQQKGFNCKCTFMLRSDL